MKKAFNVVYVGGPDGFEATRDTLSEIANVHHVKNEIAEVTTALTDADALLDASMKVKITDEMINNSKKLKVISCATTGADHIERKVVTDRKIPVHTLKNDRELLNNITPAAELSWALLMACARNLVAAVEHVHEGLWNREDFPGTMLNGKRLGVIGCGRIGQWMARYAQAFGMNVVGFDPYLEKFPEHIRKASLQEIFQTSDFVSVHVHLSEETSNLVSEELLKLAKPNLVLINTSRGAIVDQDALLRALESKRIKAAGLDVLTGEPDIANHPLVNYARKNSNLLITPHCGGYSPDSLKVVCSHAAKKIMSELTKEL